MRISDWSSDVCSSDLRTAHRITSPWKWRHLKSVIVPSVQSPPSMLKLHDFCNRARMAATVRGWRKFSRSEEHTSELQSLMRIPYAVSCFKRQILTQPMRNADHRLEAHRQGHDDTVRHNKRHKFCKYNDY